MFSFLFHEVTDYFRVFSPWSISRAKSLSDGGIAQWIRGSGQLGGPHPSPFHDSPFYDVYRCADGGCITLGALEPQFYALLMQKLGLDDVDRGRQFDPRTWPALKDRLTALFASQPRPHWDALLEGTDVCFAPVLSVAQAAGLKMA